MAEGKDAEADLREVIKLRENVIGSENPETLESYYTLATALAKKKNIAEARAFGQRAEEGAQKVLGPGHPSTKKYENLLAELQAGH
jgi:hypothetical protein